MKQITLNNRQINLLSNYNEVNLEKMVSFINIINNKNLDTIESNLLLLELLSDLSIEEIEDLDIDDFKSLVKQLIDSELFKDDSNDYINEIIIDGISYKTSFNGTFKFKIKELTSIERVIRANKAEDMGYIYKIAGIIFREADSEGKSINSFEDDDISRRSELFKEHMTMSHIAPYLKDINTHFKL